VLVGSIMFAAAGSIMYGFYSFLYKNQTFVLHFDSCFSQQICQEIDEWAQKHQQPCSAHYMMNDLQKQFACIKSLRYAYGTRGVYDVFISSHTPRMLWNATHVITEQSLLPQSYFAPARLTQLPCIKSEHSTVSLQACRNLLSISEVVLQKYAIAWHNQTRVLLHGKQHSEYIIIADDISLTDAVKIEKVSDVYYAQKISRNKKDSGKKRIYDIRFDNQIVEYVMKGKWDDAKQDIV